MFLLYYDDVIQFLYSPSKETFDNIDLQGAFTSSAEAGIIQDLGLSLAEVMYSFIYPPRTQRPKNHNFLSSVLSLD